MKTPDGQEFEEAPGGGRVGAALSAAGGVLWGGAKAVGGLVARASRLVGASALVVLRAAGKFVATVWRLFGALDAALWRGVKLFAVRAWRLFGVACAISLDGIRDVVAWIPSRTGRAYTSVSAIVLILFGLWILDEIRVSPSDANSDSALRAPLDAADPILARVEGRYIHLSEVAAAAIASGAVEPGELLTPKAAFQRGLVEAYVEQKLLSRAASNEGLHRAPEVANQLAAARDRVLASAYMEERLSETVSDESVKRLYERQSDVSRLGEEVRARQIVVASGEEAESILAALNAGGAFENVARELSLDKSTSGTGGDLGYFSRDQVDPAIAAAAFSIAIGAYSRPVQTEHGWHVLQVLDKRRSDAIPLSTVEDGIRKFLRMRTIEATILKLKQDKDVVYYGDTGSSPAPHLRDGSTGGGS